MAKWFSQENACSAIMKTCVCTPKFTLKNSEFYRGCLQFWGARVRTEGGQRQANTWVCKLTSLAESVSSRSVRDHPQIVVDSF